MEVVVIKDRMELERLEGQEQIEKAISKWALNVQPFKPHVIKNDPCAIRDSLKEILARELYKIRNDNFYVYCAERFGFRPHEVDFYLKYSSANLHNGKFGKIIATSVKTYIYFLSSNNLIKIGLTTNIKKRMAAISTMCSAPIELLGFIDGNKNTEASLHQKFANIRSHGEWFNKTDDLINFIEGACNG